MHSYFTLLYLKLIVFCLEMNVKVWNGSNLQEGSSIILLYFNDVLWLQNVCEIGVVLYTFTSFIITPKNNSALKSHTHTKLRFKMFNKRLHYGKLNPHFPYHNCVNCPVIVWFLPYYLISRTSREFDNVRALP